MAAIETEKNLSFGIVGCGQVVQELHLPAWSTISNLSLAAICDSSEVALDTVSKQMPGARRYTRFDDFLDQSGDLSFVVLATPGTTHPELAPRILATGIPLLCEKPLALSAADASSICTLADERGVMLTAIQNYRWKENTRRALHVLRTGGLGDVVAANLRFRSGPLFDESSPWRRRERENRTLLFESGIHFVDVALLFLGGLKSLQFVDADVDSLGLQRVIFGTLHENGARGVFDLMVDATSTGTELEILGESSGFSLQFFPQGFRRLPSRDTPLHRCLAEGRRLLDYTYEIASDKLWRPKCSHRARSHAELFTTFVKAIRRDAPNPLPARELLPVIQLLDDVANRAYQSISRYVGQNGRLSEIVTPD